jgi:GNAT superfamily N-acetyltransferase
MTTQQVTVRPAEERDYSAFEALYLGLLEFDRAHHPQRDTLAFDDIILARRANARAALASAGRRQTLVATYPNNALPGYVIIHLDDPGPASTDGTMLTGVIYEFYVDPAARGAGVGVALMLAAEQWFRERGAQRVKVESFAWNTDAIVFYERRGYAISDVILTRWL